ncbi:PREDICTED: leukocyte immunoglobulin-like receptor subfamily B member 5 [Ceratotherium simum simum]|uniref:Leukocyte immunoglobulin-like receptor subfamily B member 5 n=1 Tax=Ceratotherium simum simum TaxID=73337 RepID=A0ABM1DD98_CERSS|nr:PREDICTED: leukocyte immunoglobulin-like receptor subfamily B member 5 [Ceratotherium simum simum]
MIAVTVRGDKFTYPSTCLAHSGYSNKWHHRFIHDITCAQGLEKYQKVLVGVSVAFVLLLSLLLFFLLRHLHQNKCSKSGTSDPEAKTRASQKSSSSTAQVQEENQCNRGGGWP